MGRELIESISGIRGIVGSGLTPQKVVDYVSAFGQWVDGGRVVVCRDSRPTGALIRQLVISTLRSMGIEVCDIGIAPTPTAQLMTEQLDADGGIIVTASHNPEEWNGLKFVAADGLFLNGEEMKELFDVLRQRNFSFVPWKQIGEVREVHGAIDEHIESILDLSLVNAEAIAEREFRVVIDAVNGAGSVALPALLEGLGCKAIPINCVPNGIFPHNPEPRPEHLFQLCAAVKKHKADLGIVVDPDADRCGLVDATGEYLVEEYTLVMAVDAVLAYFRRVDSPMLRKPVVTNLSTTLAIEKVAEQYGVEVVRTPVGEINVTERMAQLDAAIGGEGNGGVILAESHLGRDSLVAATLILQQLTEQGTALREYFESLPQYVMSKQKVSIGDVDPDELLQQVLENAPDAEIDTQDGVKFTWSDHWVHLRKSNTEPIIRVYAEATSQQKADEFASQYLTKLNRYADQLS